MTRYFLGAYWAPRKESLDECTSRVSCFLADLVASDESLADWYELGGSKKKALEKRADIGNKTYLRGLLKRGRHWTDMPPKRLMEDLGFSLGLWNGRDDPKSAGLHITCGLYCNRLANCVTLDLPEDLGGLRDAKAMSAVLAAAAGAWEPDWGCVASSEAMDRRRFSATKPFVDWMLYVSDERLPIMPTLKPPATCERLPAGTLIVVQPDPPDAGDRADLENVKQVRTALRRRVRKASQERG